MADITKTSPLTGRTLGERIAEARGTHGWSRMEFIRRLQQHSQALEKLAHPTVFNWENDKKVPKMAALIAIAQLTGYSVEDIAEGPQPAGDEFSGSLSAEQVDRLLATQNASEAIAREVRAELAGYPPKGGVTRDEVMKILRLLTRQVASEHASSERSARALGAQRIDDAAGGRPPKRSAKNE